MLSQPHNIDDDFAEDATNGIDCRTFTTNTTVSSLISIQLASLLEVIDKESWKSTLMKEGERKW